MAWPPSTHQDVQDQIGFLQRPYARAGYYNPGLFASAVSTTMTVIPDFVPARPYLVPGPTTFDRIGVNVSSAATSGGLLALAIYSPGRTPGALFLETGTVSTETVGAKEFTISATLEPGLWWLAIRTSVASCNVTAMSTTIITPYVSINTLPPGNNTGAGGYGDNTLAPGATAFPANYTVTGNSGCTSIMLRAA